MEQDTVIEYWEKSKLLEGAKDKKKLAHLLENQKLFNASASINEKIKINFNLFKTITIPLIARLCNEFVLFDLINFDVLTRPAQNVSYRESKTNMTKEFELAAKTRWLKTRWKQDRLNELYDNELTKSEAEAKFFLEFYDSIYDEMEMEIIGDLSRNVGAQSEVEWKNIATLLDNILIRSRSIEKTSGRSAEWVIIPTEIYNEIKNLQEFVKLEEFDPKSSKIQKVGKLFNNLYVYICPQLPDLEILIGNLNYGYCYYPFILFGGIVEANPTYPDNYGLFFRYGKKLVDNSNYSKITISGYSFKKEV